VAVGLVASQVLSMVAVLVVAAIAGWRTSAEIPLWAAALLQVPMWAGLVGAVALAGSKGGGAVHDFGLGMRWYDPFLGVTVGALTQLVVLPLLYIPLLELLDVSRDELARPARELSDRAQGATGWLVLSLMVVVGAPLVEELFYRGLLLRSLEKRRWPAAASVLGSAAVFALLHFQALQFPGLFAFGVVLASLTLAFGRLGPAVWAHMAFNASTVAVLYWDSR
jgi:membrane protease YdiL (CAAX protease family)